MSRARSAAPPSCFGTGLAYSYCELRSLHGNGPHDRSRAATRLSSLGRPRPQRAGDDHHPAGTTPAGTTPAGTTPAGTTPAGTTPAGNTPAGSNPAGTNPARTNPADPH